MAVDNLNAVQARDGSWIPIEDVTGDITSVVAGTGMTGGGTQGAVTLNVDVGATEGKIVQVAASDKYPAIDGSLITDLNADELTSGTIPDARFPAVLPAVSGANLTDLPASGTTTMAKRKATSTARMNNAVPATDSDLSLTIPADEVWVVHYRIGFEWTNAVDNAGFSYNVDLTGGTLTLESGLLVEDSDGATDSIVVGYPGASGGVDSTTFTTTPSGLLDLVIVADAGAAQRTLAFQWSQFTSNANATTVRAGSCVTAIKVS